MCLNIGTNTQNIPLRGRMYFQSHKKEKDEIIFPTSLLEKERYCFYSSCLTYKLLCSCMKGLIFSFMSSSVTVYVCEASVLRHKYNWGDQERGDVWSPSSSLPWAVINNWPTYRRPALVSCRSAAFDLCRWTFTRFTATKSSSAAEPQFNALKNGFQSTLLWDKTRERGKSLKQQKISDIKTSFGDFLFKYANNRD